MATDLSFPSEYRIVAADLSLKRPGFCVMKIKRTEAETEIQKIDLYSVDNKSKTKPVGQILHEIAEKFNQIMESDAAIPTYYVREKSVNNYGFSARGGAIARAAISEVVGVTDYLVWNKRNEFEEIYPVTIKKTITGNGRAEKSLVASYLKRYVGDLDYKNDDESDATAVAVAYLILNGELKKKEAETDE